MTVTTTTEHRCRLPAAPDGPLCINGVRLDPVAPAELPDRVEAFLACGRSHVVHFVPAHSSVIARQDNAYRDVLNGGDLNSVDGAAIAAAARLYGVDAPRTTGSDALTVLPRWGVDEGVSHYLYGGAPEVVEALRDRLEEDVPGIEVVGAESPPFRDLDDEELEEAAERIRASGADLLWVGLGSPKQDFVAARLRAFDAAPVILCVGAAFDFAAGAKRRAPAWMRRIGMEWLFRLVQEPRRLWRRYLIGNIHFTVVTFADAFRFRSSRG